MKKEDILAKSRNERSDEYEQKIINDAQLWGVIILAILCMFFTFTPMLYADIQGLEKARTVYEFPAILFAYTSAINFYSFHKTKTRMYLVIALCFCLGSLAFIALYLINL